MEHPFARRLRAGPVIVADGAMGTELYARGIPYEECFDAQNVENPDIVEGVHRDYIVAGADLIETNTFGANRVRLGSFGFEDRVRELNVRGARLARGAREICGVPVFVAGSVGPTGRQIEPYGRAKETQLEDVFKEQIAALMEGGVDLLVLETFGDLREIRQAVRAAKAESDLPIVAEMTFAEDLRTLGGFTPEQVVDELAGEVAVVGANCSVGSNTLLEVVERLLTAGAEYVSAMPNAGWPARVGNRVIYLSGPEYMAEYGRQMADLGARIVGGCCGTTPRHTAALCRALRDETEVGGRIEVVPSVEPEGGPEPAEDATLFARKLGRTPVISVEIRPPRGANPAKAVEGARLLRAAGSDAVNVLDSAMARVRMSAVATAVLIRQQTGIDPILHFTTRDRNLMAIQSDLIGAHALGVRTVLALTGDPPTLGDYAQSKAVYDVDSIGLIRIIKQLNAGVDVAGNSIGSPTRFMVGCALNPMAEDLDWELSRFQEKVEAGADFVMTQPVYDAGLFRSVLDQIGDIDIPILWGIRPLQIYGHALFRHNELPGWT